MSNLLHSDRKYVKMNVTNQAIKQANQSWMQSHLHMSRRCENCKNGICLEIQYNTIQ
jgi:hypothetical protein